MTAATITLGRLSYTVEAGPSPIAPYDFSRVVPGLGALVTLALSSASGAGKVAA